MMIFIDAANIERQARDIGIMRVPWHLIRDQLRGDDTLLGAYYYTGTDLRVEGFRQQLDYLVTHGFRVVHKRSKELPGGGYKGNLDIEMSLDMLDFVGFYDRALALTGDGDFIPVFSRLRDRGVQVMVSNFGVGSDPGLKLVADGYINLGLLLSLVIEHEKVRTDQAQFDQPELPLGETLDTHVDRNMLASRLYSLGRNSFDRNELTQALNLFAQAARLMPRQARYRHRLALSMAALGRYADAAIELEDLVRQQNADVEVFYDLGKVYERLGALDKALDAYTRCSSLDSRYKDVQSRKQELESASKSNGQETSQRGRGTRTRPTSASRPVRSAPAPQRSEAQPAPARSEPQAESTPAPRESNGRKRSKPEPSAKKAPAKAAAPAAAPSSVTAGMGAAFQHMLKGEHQEAVATLEQVGRLDPDSLEVKLAQAQQLAVAGEHTQAAMAAEQLVLDNPERYEPIAVLGRICYERGKFQDALEQFTQALELTKQSKDVPAQAFLCRMIVWTHLETGNEAEALVAAETGRKATPEDQQLRRLYERVKGVQEPKAPAAPSQDGAPAEVAQAAETAPVEGSEAVSPMAAASAPKE
jgi:tetratricopeptide (TPR) repeat protein